MPERHKLAKQFLAKTGWKKARREHLAGDASRRRYERLRQSCGKSAVLMDSPDPVAPFIRISRHLHTLGLSAPQIMACDEENGFLLLEDFGDALFARLIQKDSGQEHMIYTAAVDLLLDLHRHPAPDGLLEYTPAVMAQYAAPAFDWYQINAGKQKDEKTAVLAELETVLAQHCTHTPVMALRDFHTENLIWLPARRGIRRVGLLDYQDALKAHPAYDLVSLLEDARRDMPPEIQTAMIAHYVKQAGVDSAVFRTAYAAQGAQRNLRILGVFARLCLKGGKSGYIDLIPRVWRNLKHDLSHPALHRLNLLVLAALPEPTPEYLQRLKSKCAKPRNP